MLISQFLNSILVTIGSSSETSDIESEDINQNETPLPIVSTPATSSMKNSLSFAISQTSTGKTKKIDHPVNSSPASQCSFRSFIKKSPGWVGKINVDADDFDEQEFLQYQQYQCKKITNSCSIDYFLFGLWYSKQQYMIRLSSI